MPKSARLRGRSGIRPIGLLAPEGEWLSIHVELRRALEGKRKKYGVLGLPFLIAINATEDCDNIDIMNALYGDEVTIIRQGPDGSLTENWGRNQNGAWLGETGPRATLISGALIAAGLHPWNMGVLTPELFLNPWASNPFPAVDWPMPYCIADLSTDHVRHQPGESAGKLLGIPAVWPLAEDYGLARVFDRLTQNNRD
jgi:hypothetical protein